MKWISSSFKSYNSGTVLLLHAVLATNIRIIFENTASYIIFFLYMAQRLLLVRTGGQTPCVLEISGMIASHFRGFFVILQSERAIYLIYE